MSGCEVESNKRLQQGRELPVLLHLPDGNPPREIQVARVRWSRGQHFGLKFLTMEPDQQARLRRVVSSLAGARVARLVGTEASSSVSAVQELVDDPEEDHRVAHVSTPYGNAKGRELIGSAIVEWWNQRNDPYPVTASSAR